MELKPPKYPEITVTKPSPTFWVRGNRTNNGYRSIHAIQIKGRFVDICEWIRGNWTVSNRQKLVWHKAHTPSKTSSSPGKLWDSDVSAEPMGTDAVCCCGTWLERELLGALDDRSLISWFIFPSLSEPLDLLVWRRRGENTVGTFYCVFPAVFSTDLWFLKIQF